METRFSTNIFLAIITILLHASDIHAQTCSSPPQCTSSMEYALMPANHTTNNHLYLGGLFGVHAQVAGSYECGGVSVGGIQHLEAFSWAVETFKERHRGKLGDISLGTIAFDTCQMPEKGIQQTLNFLQCEQSFGTPSIDPESVMAFIGSETLTEASSIGGLLSDRKRTLISHAASASRMSHQHDLQYFLRTVPSDTFQMEAMLALLQDADWQYVQVVAGADPYGTSMHGSFTEQLENTDICAVNTETIPNSPSSSDFQRAITSLRRFPDTKIVLILLNTDDTNRFLRAANSAGIQGQFTWLATSSWGTRNDVTMGAEETSRDALTLQLADFDTRQVDLFESYFLTLTSDTTRNPWFGEYTALNSDFMMDTYTPFVIQAVDAALLGIHEAIVEKCGSSAICGSFLNDANKWALVHDKIRGINIQSTVRFDKSTGDQLDGYVTIHRRYPSGVNEIGSYRALTLSLIGGSTPDVTSICAASPCTTCSETTPPSTITDPTTTMPQTLPTGAPSSRKDKKNPPNERRDGSWVIVLLILAAIGILVVFVFEVIIMCKLSGSSLSFKRIWLGQMLLFAIFLSYLCLFAFVPSPTDTTCGILRFGVGACYAMIFACLLVKLMILLSSQTVGFLKGIFQVLMFIFAWGVQIAIVVVWLVLRNPEAEHDDKEDMWVCAEDFDNHVTTLAYVMFLIIICTILAAKANGIVTNHRESLLILIACCVIIPVFLIWLLIGFLADNKEYEDPCLAFGLFAIATIVLVVMFVPKIKQLSTMGVEGVWSVDDGPEYAASIIPPSLPPMDMVANHHVIGNHNIAYLGSAHKPAQMTPPIAYVGSAHKPAQMTPPIVYVDDVDLALYSEPIDYKPHVTKVKDPDALYLRHPATEYRTTGSVRSMPIGRVTGASHSDLNNTRVLKVTGDLAGRGPYERKARSEVNIPTGYGTTRSTRSARSVISTRSDRPTGVYYSLQRPRSIHDLGSL